MANKAPQVKESMTQVFVHELKAMAKKPGVSENDKGWIQTIANLNPDGIKVAVSSKRLERIRSGKPAEQQAGDKQPGSKANA